MNVVLAFIRQKQGIVRGKEYSYKFINGYYQSVDNFKSLEKDKTVFIVNKSSHSLQIPDQVVDVIVTDPPFGGNVQYAELSDF